MKKLQVLLLLVGVGFLGFLLWRIGPGELWHELRLLGWGLVPVLLSEGVAEMIHTRGWHYCLSGPQRSLPWRTLFPIRMAGYAINYLTPTASLGGEATKAALLAAHSPGPEAVSGVLIGKLCFGFAHLLFAVAGSVLVIWQVTLPGAIWVGMAISSTVIATGMGTFLVLQKRGKLGAVIRWLDERKFGGRAFEKFAANVTQVDEALQRFYRERPGDLRWAICWHLAGYSLGIVQTWYFLFLLTPHASWLAAAVVWFLGMWFDLVTFAVPLNAGALEGTRIVTLKAVGADALLGMTYGVSQRLAQLFWSAFGLVCYGWLTWRGKVRRRRSEASQRALMARVPREEAQGVANDHQVREAHSRSA